MKARQSVHPGPAPVNYFTNLDICAENLQHACESVDAAVKTLDEGVSDYPRLSALLRSRRAHELVTESEIQAAQYQVSSDLEPQIKELIERAEGGLERLKKRDRLLSQKVELRNAPPANAVQAASQVESAASLEKKLANLRSQKEKLSKEVERLEGDAERKRAQLSAV